MMNALAMFDRLKKLPGGTRLFSLGVCNAAPYFKTIRPHVTTLQPGLVKVAMRKRRAVENHLHTVHAIAMCNMAELAGGLLTDVSVPPGARWIPSGMTVHYQAKAKTDLIATSDGSGIDWSREGNIVVPVSVTDTAGTEVFRADITMNVKHAKG
ncbi:MAG: hotdog fold domain-containing protein [Gammaproteobacteria bacterium]